MQGIVTDLRYALRQLRRSPGFTATALLTLTLAIGATTAMVSVLRATLLNPTPYPGASQLVSIRDVNLKGFKANGLVTVARAADLAEAPAAYGTGKLLASSAFYYFDQPAMIIAGHAPLSTSAVDASGDFFRVLGTAPLLGRSFTPADDAHGAPETAVLSYGLWQRSFGGDASVVGRNVLLAGKATTIIGVMPRHFGYPQGAELWKPAHLFAQDFRGYRGGGTRFVQVIGRLHGGALPGAQRLADLLAARLRQSYPATDGEWGFKLVGVRSEILGSYRQGLVLVSSAVAILLLIACANTAGLELSRNRARSQEMAVRRALGISTPRLLQQLLTESMLLLAIGAGLGILFAMALLRLCSAALPAALLSFDQPHLDPGTLLVTITVSIAASVLCALAPAFHLGRTPALCAAESRTVSGRTHRFGYSFATAQIALALVLLTIAAGLLQGLYRLLEMPLGYQPMHVLTTSVHFPFGTDPGKIHHFVQQFEQRIGSLPGVDTAGAIDALPLSPFMVQWTADIFGQPVTEQHDAVSAQARQITSGYLNVMQIPLLAGRSLEPRDSEPGAPPVVLVNQSLAQKYFTGAAAVGQRFVLKVGADSGPRAALASAEIVGVIGDVHGTGGDLDSPIAPEVDAPEKGRWPDMHFVLRTALPTNALESPLRKALATLEPEAALGPVEPMALSLDHALAQPRLNTALLTALAALALLLVLIGVYGVVAFSIAERTHELAVRLALGSSRVAIFRMLVLDAARVLGAGLALGIVGALGASRLLAALDASAAFTGKAVLPYTLALSSALLTLAVLGASSIPARRATSIDPMRALRSE